jgi:hypothetical protein
MKNFRRLCFALLLMAAFSVPVFADGGSTQGPSVTAPGDTQGPSVAAPGDSQEPGDGHSPGLAAPGETQGPGWMAAILLAIQVAV